MTKVGVIPLSTEQRHAALERLGKERARTALLKMQLIRAFEQRGEAAYQQGLVGGFYHSYAGQEAIATAAVLAFTEDAWWTTTYRCHGLALLLGVSPESAMAELFGKASGNAKGRGGSMHLFSDRLLGGHGIVGGGLPIAAGAALASRYLQQDRLSICLFGDGAVAQGAFHETLNLASLWSLPLVAIIENNHWGMGTAVGRAIAAQPIAETQAPSYGLQGYTVDGSDLLAVYHLCTTVAAEVRKTQKPVLIEAMTQRFRGHSISDPGLYRTQEQLERCKAEEDPIRRFASTLIDAGYMSPAEVEQGEEEAKQVARAAFDYAKGAAWPQVEELELGVFAPDACGGPDGDARS